MTGRGRKVLTACRGRTPSEQMGVEHLSIAEVELAEAVAYYNEQSEGLGYEFAAGARFRARAGSTPNSCRYLATVRRAMWMPREAIIRHSS